MFNDISRTLAQLQDPKLLKPLILSLAAAFALLALLTALVVWLLLRQDFGGYGFFGLSLLDRAIAWVIDASLYPLSILLALLLFPAAALGLQSLFLDSVAEAVEARHYPGLAPARKQRVGEIVGTALRLAAIALGLNLLLLVVWLVLLVIATPIAPIPFYLVNGYILGREYFELVALRRMGPVEAGVLRKQKLGWNMVDGVALTFLFTIPIVNFAAPIIAAAYMTHRFHRVWRPGMTVQEVTTT